MGFAMACAGHVRAQLFHRPPDQGLGRRTVIAIGMVLLFAAGVVGILDIKFGNFAVSLILLGLGWNFGFIGGTTMLTTTYTPAERGKVQAANDFGISALMVVASFSSGKVLDSLGLGIAVSFCSCSPAHC